MKKSLPFLFVALMMFSLAGCGSNDTETGGNDTNLKQDALVKDEVSQSIEDNLSENIIGLLYDEMDGLTTVVSDGKIYVTARVGVEFYIPLVAQELCPIVVDEASKNECDMDIVIRKYGTGENTSVSWHSTDGETGTFLDTTQNKIEPKATIDDLCEYYSSEISEWSEILLNESK